MMTHLRFGEVNEACALIEREHYSHRSPANIQLCATWHADGGLLGDAGEAVAACVFSIPPTRWAEDVFELSRLVRSPNMTAPLTGLIAAACNELRRRKLIDLAVSFADWTQRHHGGIYQACSWNYHEMRERRMDGVVVDGVFVPGRSANWAWGTSSPCRLASIGITAEPHFDEGKHLYWRPILKSGKAKATRLGLESRPYPKPKNDAIISLDTPATPC